MKHTHLSEVTATGEGTEKQMSGWDLMTRDQQIRQEGFMFYSDYRG